MNTVYFHNYLVLLQKLSTEFILTGFSVYSSYTNILKCTPTYFHVLIHLILNSFKFSFIIYFSFLWDGVLFCSPGWIAWLTSLDVFGLKWSSHLGLLSALAMVVHCQAWLIVCVVVVVVEMVPLWVAQAGLELKRSSALTSQSAGIIGI